MHRPRRLNLRVAVVHGRPVSGASTGRGDVGRGDGTGTNGAIEGSEHEAAASAAQWSVVIDSGR